MKEKILIGITLHDSKSYIIKDFLENLKKIVDQPDTRVDVLMVDNSKDDTFANWISSEYKYHFTILRHGYSYENSKERQCCALNVIRKYMLMNYYTHLFSLEADLLPESDIIYHLIDKDKDACSAVYLLDKYRGIPCITKENYVANNKVFPAVMVNHGFIDGELKEAENGVGLGCVLIKRKVLEQIKFRTATNHADTYFWEDAKAYGFKAFIDTSQIARHYPNKTKGDDKSGR